MILNVWNICQDEMVGLDCPDLGNRQVTHLLGLAGEVGEVLEPIKKHMRDGTKLDREHLASELGDVLFYVNMIAYDHGIPMAGVVRGLLTKLGDRRAKDKM